VSPNWLRSPGVPVVERSTIRLPRLLEPSTVSWNVDANMARPLTDSIEIMLPITPGSLKGKSKDYVMYAAYYIRKHCPEQLGTADVTMEVHRRVEYMDYMIAVSVKNPTLGQLDVSAIVQEADGQEAAIARKMMFERIEQAYIEQRHAILKEAVQRGQAND